MCPDLFSTQEGYKGGKIAPLFHSTWQAAVLRCGDVTLPTVLESEPLLVLPRGWPAQPTRSHGDKPKTLIFQERKAHGHTCTGHAALPGSMSTPTPGWEDRQHCGAAEEGPVQTRTLCRQLPDS